MTKDTAILIAILAAFLAHVLTKLRFKNELRIKKQEKIINDAKELSIEFEKKIFSRIHLTRDYLYEMRRAKIQGREMDKDFRIEYRKMIKEWNLNLDFTSSSILRYNIIGKINSIDELQRKFKSYHIFFHDYADNLKDVEFSEIKEKQDSISELQSYCYRFIQGINNNIDNKWEDLLNDKGRIRRFLNESYKYIMTTLFIYMIINIFSFFLGYFFL